MKNLSVFGFNNSVIIILGLFIILLIGYTYHSSSIKEGFMRNVTPQEVADPQEFPEIISPLDGFGRPISAVDEDTAEDWLNSMRDQYGNAIDKYYEPEFDMSIPSVVMRKRMDNGIIQDPPSGIQWAPEDILAADPNTNRDLGIDGDSREAARQSRLDRETNPEREDERVPIDEEGEYDGDYGDYGDDNEEGDVIPGELAEQLERDGDQANVFGYAGDGFDPDAPPPTYEEYLADPLANPETAGAAASRLAESQRRAVQLYPEEPLPTYDEVTGFQNYPDSDSESYFSDSEGDDDDISDDDLV